MNEIEKLEAHIESIGETLFSPMGQEIHELLTESRTWLMSHLRHLRSEASKPVLTEADSLADLAGTPRPDATAANEAQPEPPSAA